MIWNMINTRWGRLGWDLSMSGAPEQVTGLVATNVPDTRIDLDWVEPDGNGSDISGYKIERRLCSGGWVELVADTGTTDVSYSDTTVIAGTCYGYRVSAINGVGMGLVSDEDTSCVTVTGDTFTGDNGDPADPALWDDYFNGPHEIQSNQLQVTDISADAAVKSKFFLHGNFTFDIDWNDFPRVEHTQQALMIRTADGQNGYKIYRDFEVTWDFVYALELVDGTWDVGNQLWFAVTSTDGKFRVVRTSGTSMNLWFKDGALGWNSLWTGSGSSGPLQIFLISTGTVAGSTYKWDNLIINGGDTCP